MEARTRKGRGMIRQNGGKEKKGEGEEGACYNRLEASTRGRVNPTEGRQERGQRGAWSDIK